MDVTFGGAFCDGVFEQARWQFVLVGFDARCNRLGMGGGYYDRTLAYLRHRVHWRRPLLVGVAHECQRVERLEANPWDVPLDLVVTERRIYAR